MGITINFYNKSNNILDKYLDTDLNNFNIRIICIMLNYN